MKANPNIIRATLLMAVAIAAAIGCARPKAPGVEETKAIAEEAYIYGLPLVMNYAVMHDFAINRNSGQFKAPFNQIANEARVFTHQDTAVIVPNSDTPTKAPTPGQHTDEVLADVLGYGPDRVAELRSAGAFG